MRIPILMSLSLLAVPALAAPGTIPVQGELTDDAGEPIDNALSVTFTLYADPGGRTALWTETQTIDFDLGAFTAYLGTATNLDLDLFADHPDTWLGVAIDSGAEMDLLPIGTVPYAAYAPRAGDADLLSGLSAEDFRRSDTPVAWSDLDGLPSGLGDGDDNTEYSAGRGLSLLADEFSVDYAALNSDVEPLWSNVSGIPSDLVDGDDDTTYTNGSGLLLSGGTFSVDYKTVDAAVKPSWSNLTGVPGGFADGSDDDTTYTAGTGITITGTTVSTNASYIQDEAKKVCYYAPSQITGIITSSYIASNLPSDLADGDDDTTYTAGTGLDLVGGAFSVDLSDLTSELDLDYRRIDDAVSWSDLSGVPAGLDDGDDVGILVADLADEIEGLSALDLPAGTTIGGEGVPTASIAKPVIQFGQATAVPIQTYYGGIIDFERFFTKSPAWALGIDESIDNNGASWCHGRREGINRAWFRCNTTADALYWMAVETGRHTVDGKEIEAGIVSSAKALDSVFFGKTFTTAPAVFLMGGWNNVYARVNGISGATTGGFQIGAVSTASQPLHWIALTPGDYTYNGYHFEVGTVTAPRNNGTYSLTGTFKSLPNMYYTIWDTNNSGAVYVRTIDVTTSSFQIYMDSNSSEYLYYVAVEKVQ